MHGERLGRQAGGERGRQRLRALAQGLEHARRGLAGGGGERDAQLGLSLEQTGKQRGDGGGLAGARTAADDGEPALQREHHGAALPVRALAGARREQGVEQGRARRGLVGDRGAPRARHQRRRQCALLVEMPAQVKPIARIHHQRMRRASGHSLGGVDHHAAGQQPRAQACKRGIGDRAAGRAGGWPRSDGLGGTVRIHLAGRHELVLERVGPDFITPQRRAVLRPRRARPRERLQRHAHMPGAGRDRQPAGDGLEQREAVGGRAEGGGPVGQMAGEAVGEVVHAAASASSSARPASSASSACRVAAGQRWWNTPAGRPSHCQPGRTPRTKR